MARVTHVKAAQAQYKMVPALDENGEQKTVEVLNARTGQPRTNKRGKATVRRLTVRDLNQPLPLRKCDKCHKDIEVGTPYKWIAPKSGPYGGRKRFRHEGCPTWQVWEYSSSLSARIAQIQHDAEQDQPTEADTSEMESYLSGVAEQVRELAEEKRESAQNIEDGFGHPTSASDELNETADALEGWADDIENTDPGEVPDECDEQEDEGHDEDDCEKCQEYNNFDADQWIADAVEAIDNCPV